MKKTKNDLLRINFNKLIMSFLSIINDFQQLAFTYILNNYSYLPDSFREVVFEKNFKKFFSLNKNYNDFNDLEKDITQYCIDIEKDLFDTYDENITLSPSFQKFVKSSEILFQKMRKQDARSKL
jgi:hypothetical protein